MLFLISQWVLWVTWHSTRLGKINTYVKREQCQRPHRRCRLIRDLILFSWKYHAKNEKNRKHNKKRLSRDGIYIYNISRHLFTRRSSIERFNNSDEMSRRHGRDCLFFKLCLLRRTNRPDELMCSVCLSLCMYINIRFHRLNANYIDHQPHHHSSFKLQNSMYRIIGYPCYMFLNYYGSQINSSYREKNQMLEKWILNCIPRVFGYFDWVWWGWIN